MAERFKSFLKAAKESESWDANLPIISPERLLEEVEHLRGEIRLSGNSEPIWLCFATHRLRGIWQSMLKIGGAVPDLPHFLDRDWRVFVPIAEGQMLEGLGAKDLLSACNLAYQYCATWIKVGADTKSVDWNELFTSPPLSAKQIAAKLGQPTDIVAKKLRDYRTQNAGGYIVDEERGKGDDKYFHKMEEVVPVLKKWLEKRLRNQSKPYK